MTTGTANGDILPEGRPHIKTAEERPASLWVECSFQLCCARDIGSRITSAAVHSGQARGNAVDFHCPATTPTERIAIQQSRH